MARAFAAPFFAVLADLVRMVDIGALEIRTPDDGDPALVTAIQLDGDIVCSIYQRRVDMLVGSGETLEGLAACHRDAMARRLGAMTAKVALLSHPVALLASLGLWGAVGLGVGVRIYVWSVVVVPLIHWGVRRSPRAIMPWVIRITRRAIARDLKRHPPPAQLR